MQLLSAIINESIQLDPKLVDAYISKAAIYGTLKKLRFRYNGIRTSFCA